MTPFTRFRTWIRQSVAPFIILVAVWQAVVMLGLWPPSFFPSPFSLPRTIVDLWFGSELLTQILSSMVRVALAGLVGFSLAIVLGVTFALSKVVSMLLRDVVIFFQAVGEIGWLPMFVLWLGFNEKTILITVAYTVFFPVFFGTVTGFAAVPRNLCFSILTLGAGRSTLLWEVLLPGALPSIIAGLRTGLGFAWRTVILAEMLVSSVGLGAILFRAQQFFLIEQIMVGMGVIGLVWLLTDELLLTRIEARTIRRWGIVR
jgi:NitT/TauT family transport system permease protein/taurine transport system permease protein